MARRVLYSTSALRAAQRVFALSVAEPTNLFLRGEDFGDELPPGRILLCPLRDLLLRRHTSMATRDAVWRELIRRARADRSTWLVVAMGMAMPGLRRAVRALSLAFPGDRDDLESAIAEGFVTELYRVDLAGKALCARLVRAGHRAGVKQAYQDAERDGAGWSQFASHAPQAPWGHPDFVLAEAVRTGVLSQEEAWLIGVTRLEHIPVGEVAAMWGESTNTVVVRRHRAEHRLRNAILAGGLTSRSDLDRVAPGLSGLPEVSGSSSAGERVLAGVSRPAGNCRPTRRPFPGTESPAVAG